jgi:NADH-quinone oxidoreductase subunit G
MPRITIDGTELEFNQGQTIIEAAKDHGIEIPHFCWHPSLSISGNCRICLVEVEKMPKLVIACSTLAADGMVVHTQSEKTLKAREAVMEFILANHPLDCPICDEAGECKLQDYAYQHSVGESRFVENKVHKDKRVELGPRIIFDGERCISCSRCIRFSDEIAKSNQLTFVKRGDRVTITTFPGERFDNPYTLNTVDICPVGALTSMDARFKARVWEMSSTKSVCVGCARGCNTEVWVRNNEIIRLTPRYNPEVNDYWMCDNGRLNTFKLVNRDDRIDSPLMKGSNGELDDVSWEKAFETAFRQLKNFKPDEIAFVGSAHATCEDNYIFAKLAKSFGCANLDFARHIDRDDEDDILIRGDKTPNALGAELVGIKPGKEGLDIAGIVDGIKSKKIKAVYVIEDDLTDYDDDLKDHLDKLELLIVHATNMNETAANGDIVFPAAAFAEKNGTFVNFQGTIQRIRSAVATKEMDRALDQMSMSRWDKFGSEFDRWMQGKKVDAKSSWKILLTLLSKSSSGSKLELAEDVFDEISKNIKEFNGLDYEVIGDSGKKINIEVLA